MFGKFQKTEDCRDGIENLSVAELDCVSGSGGTLDECTIKCSTDPNVTNDTQLKACIDKCMKS